MSLTSTTSLDQLKPPGRNDSCPCKSGKKYKKCCYLKEVSSAYDPDLKVRLLTRLDELVWSDDKSGKIVKNYLEKMVDGVDRIERKVGENEARFVMEATIFEGKRTKQNTLAEYAISKLSKNDPDYNELRNIVEKSFFSYFDVERVEIGRGMWLSDVWTGEKYYMHEKSGTYEISQDMMVYSRLIPCDANWQGTGMLFRIPQGLEYLLKMAKQGKQNPISQLDQVRLLYDKTKPKSPEGIKERLRLLTKKCKHMQELWDNWGKFESNPQEFEMEKYLAIIAKCVKSEKKRREASQLLVNLGNQYIRDTGVQVPGPIEQAMMMGVTAEVKPGEVIGMSKKKQNKFFQRRLENYLDKKQKKLDGKTPREIILKERRSLDNRRTKIEYQMNMQSTDGEVMQKNIRALTLQQEKKFWEALDLYGEIVEQIKTEIPEPYRCYANIGGLLAELGLIDLAKKYTQRALDLKPDYKVALNNYGQLGNSKQVKQRQVWGYTQLFWESYDEWDSLPIEKVEDVPLMVALEKYIELVKSGKIKLTKKRKQFTKKSFELIQRELEDYSRTTNDFSMNVADLAEDMGLIIDDGEKVIISQHYDEWSGEALNQKFADIVSFYLDIVPGEGRVEGDDDGENLEHLGNIQMVAIMATHIEEGGMKVSEIEQFYLASMKGPSDVPRDVLQITIMKFYLSKLVAVGWVRVEKKWVVITGLGKRGLSAVIKMSYAQIPESILECC